MLRTVILGLINLGSFLMVYNIYGFVRYARRIKKMNTWGNQNAILYIPITLLVMFLLGYLVVGFFGKPDLIIAGILFFGSVFVFVMYLMLSRITDRIVKNEQLAAKMLAAEESSRVKTEFLAVMSHEMRTPMNVILGLTDLARKEPGLPEKTKQQLEKIDQSGQHLLELINHILEINELGSGVIQLREELMRPADMLAQVNAIAQTLCENKGLSYRYEAPEELPACCVGDEIQIKNILLGLLDNAIKYTDVPGKVSFAAECTQHDDRAELSFTVTDTGVGMSSEFLARIFEPFTQEDTSFSNRFGGSGLGLAVSKKMSDLMGGTLEVQSEKGKGSAFTFKVSLPVIVCPEEESAGGEEQEISLAGRRVLVVEDIPENAEIIQDLLELEDMESDHAENGLVALEKFESLPPGTYDAILMDLRMPVMDGLTAARRIRALPRPDAAVFPIIAVTANSFQNDVDASFAAGMNAHLAKPADANELYTTLQKWISIAQKQKGESGHD